MGYHKKVSLFWFYEVTNTNTKFRRKDYNALYKIQIL